MDKQLCAQCDGLGKEIQINGKPIACRRCNGNGFNQSIPKTSKLSFVIEKTAQNDLSNQGEIAGELETETFYQTAPADNMDINELRSSLGVHINLLNSPSKVKVFEILCSILGVDKDTILGEHIDQNKFATIATDYIYDKLDEMTLEQLKTLDHQIKNV